MDYEKRNFKKNAGCGFYAAVAAPLLRAERIDVSGRVTDADRTPLLGVIVRAGAADGVLTDVNGNFLVKGVERGSMLTFSYIGYKTRSVAADSVRLHVVLESDNLQLEEACVVVGYGTEKQSLRAERMPRAVFAADCGLPLPGAGCRKRRSVRRLCRKSVPSGAVRTAVHLFDRRGRSFLRQSPAHDRQG